MKINGFVNLKTDYILNQACLALARIEDKRVEYKQKIIDNERHQMLEKNWYERFFNIEKDIPTDEQVWTRLRYEADNTFLGTYPEYWVSQYCEAYENQLKEILDATKTSEEMLVNSELAAKLSRGDDF